MAAKHFRRPAAVPLPPLAEPGDYEPSTANPAEVKSGGAATKSAKAKTLALIPKIQVIRRKTLADL